MTHSTRLLEPTDRIAEVLFGLILPSIRMSMEMKDRESGDDIVRGGEKDSVRN